MVPSSLQTLTFGYGFDLTHSRRSISNQSVEGVTLPSSLQTLSFWRGKQQELGDTEHLAC